MERLPPGTTIAGYRVDALLGRGGMGAVFKARQLSLDRTVALKILPRSFADRQDKVDRFLREARLAAQLSHPNVVQMIDAGQDGDVFFMAMEYVEGEDLSRLVKGHGVLPNPVVVALGIQAARALAAANEGGLVHRDIKPDNIIVTPRGVVKVADFGLARDVTSAARLTRPGAIMGTPAYMSPEQARGEVVDHLSDLYSLGATLYFCLAGRPPFTGGTPVEVVRKVVKEPPPALSLRNPAVDPALVRLVMKTLEKAKVDRPAGAAELLAGLEALSGGAGREDLDLAGKGGAAVLEQSLTLELPNGAGYGEALDPGRFQALTVDETPGTGRSGPWVLHGHGGRKTFVYGGERVPFGRKERVRADGAETHVPLVLRAMPFRDPRQDPETYARNLAISRLHGWFDLTEAGLSVTCRPSTQGLSVDGRPAPESVAVPVNHGGRVSVGPDAALFEVALQKEGGAVACAVLARRDPGCDHVHVLLRVRVRLDRARAGDFPFPAWLEVRDEGIGFRYRDGTGVSVGGLALDPGTARPLPPGTAVRWPGGGFVFDAARPEDFKQP